MADHEEPVDRRRIPLACTLEPGVGPARLAHWRALHESGAPVNRRLDGQLVVHHRSAMGVLEELQNLAASEQVCCAFVEWTVSREHGQPMLRVISPEGSPDALAPIVATFEIIESSKTASAWTIGAESHQLSGQQDSFGFTASLA